MVLSGPSPRPRRARGDGLAAAVVATAALAGPLAGQTVTSARLAVDLTPGDGSAVVRLEYELDGAGPEPVPLELLAPEGVEAREAFTPEGTRLVLTRLSGMRSGTQVPPEALPASGAPLVLLYRVDGAVRARGGAVEARVPVLSVALPPREAPDVFHASLSVPGRWSVSDGFPSGLREVEPGRHEVELPVVPSLVSLHGRSDGAWRPGVALLVELLTAVILFGFGVAGLRHLRGAHR